MNTARAHPGVSISRPHALCQHFVLGVRAHSKLPHPVTTLLLKKEIDSSHARVMHMHLSVRSLSVSVSCVVQCVHTCPSCMRARVALQLFGLGHLLKKKTDFCAHSHITLKWPCLQAGALSSDTLSRSVSVARFATVFVFCCLSRAVCTCVWRAFRSFCTFWCGKKGKKRRKKKRGKYIKLLKLGSNCRFN